MRPVGRKQNRWRTVNREVYNPEAPFAAAGNCLMALPKSRRASEYPVTA